MLRILIKIPEKKHDYGFINQDFRKKKKNNDSRKEACIISV